jgi:hypothetical protein
VKFQEVLSPRLYSFHYLPHERRGGGRGSSVNTKTRLRAGDRGSIPGRGNDGIFFSSPLRPNRLWGPPSFLSNGYQGLFLELYLHSPNTPSWRGAQLKHRDNFTFYILLLAWYLVQHRDKFTCTFLPLPLPSRHV